MSDMEGTAETAEGYDSGITVASNVFAFVTATTIMTTELHVISFSAAISSLFVAVTQCWRWSCSTRRRRRPPRSMFLPLRSICSIDPFRVNVYRFRKILNNMNTQRLLASQITHGSLYSDIVGRIRGTPAAQHPLSYRVSRRPTSHDGRRGT
jgi:hypothetical protein